MISTKNGERESEKEREGERGVGTGTQFISSHMSCNKNNL